MPRSSITKGHERSRPVFVEWHKHKGMMRFYRKFFRSQYPGAVMWLVTLGVWLRFSAVASYHTVRRVGHALRLDEDRGHLTVTAPLPAPVGPCCSHDGFTDFRPPRE